MADLFGTPPITREHKIAEIEREIAMRQRVYRDRVSERRMSQAQADRQLGIMVAILQDYTGEAFCEGVTVADGVDDHPFALLCPGRPTAYLTLAVAETLHRDLGAALRRRNVAA